MGKALSIIIPSRNEFPQVAFTIQNVITTLECTPLDYEVLLIDNMSTVEKHWLDGKARHRLRVFHHDDHEGHWGAKNVGIENAKADTLFFMDAHCIVEPNALVNMFKDYKTKYTTLNGSLHMPIRYLLDVPGRELVYQHTYNKPDGLMLYSFRRMTEYKKIHKVPCMSTCGMMISKEILVDELGMWPAELGIYGGGENWLNFTMAMIGRDINIWPFNPIHHYAYKRGYGWNYDNFQRNHIIAAYHWGGVEWVDRFIKWKIKTKGDKFEILNEMKEDIMVKCSEQKEHIESQRLYTPETWMEKVRREMPEYIQIDVK
jgi:glycosyltransferase involved in cell wall biosynthesis